MKKHTEAQLEDASIDCLTTRSGYFFVDRQVKHLATTGKIDVRKIRISQG